MASVVLKRMLPMKRWIAVSLLVLASTALAIDDRVVTGRVIQKLDSGILISGRIDGGMMLRAPESGTFHIKGYPAGDNIIDGVTVRCRVSDVVGNYSYTDVLGSRRTVSEFTFYSFLQGENGIVGR